MSGGVSLAGDATSVIFVGTKHVFCRGKSMLAARDKIVSCDKIFLRRQIFFTTSTGLSRQAYFCSVCVYRPQLCLDSSVQYFEPILLGPLVPGSTINQSIFYFMSVHIEVILDKN